MSHTQDSLLPADSFTLRRLEHASPEHLHSTTRRTFIGPIPEGWLKSNRKQWYRHYISQGGNRAPTFTAARPVASTTQSTGRDEDGNAGLAVAGASTTGGESADPPHRPSSQSADTQAHARTDDSTLSSTSLLHGHRERSDSAPNERVSSRRGPTDMSEIEPANARTSSQYDGPPRQRTTDMIDRVTSKLATPRVRFSDATRLQLRNRAQRIAARGNFRTSKIKPGELMKMDRMLVRIDITQQSIREDYDERVSQGVETRSLDKWREFMVVCRKHAEGGIIQLYQTRVIATTADETKKKPKAEILMSRKGARVNLFSSLDKTLCIWTSEHSRTSLYYLRPQSGAASVEWYTFLRGLIGLERTTMLQVNVPDLRVSLRLEDPFNTLSSAQIMAEAAEGDDEALAKAISEEKGAAGAIVSRCVNMLKQSPEWEDVLKSWARTDKIGLAWKRYDRLEWIHGATEQRMYGTIAMQRTHDLELRPKDHYPLTTRTQGGDSLTEPAPVEGFLIRLTTPQGREKRIGRIGRMSFKRLYFMTHNQFLVFLKPSSATPPPPPKMAVRNPGNVPSTRQILDQVPLTYDVDPYPLQDEEISWMDNEGITSASEQRARDREAAGEADRNMKMLLACDGFINLCDIEHVRKMHKGAVPADELLDSGSDVEFDGPVLDRSDRDGTTGEVDEDRVLELVLKNGLVIRLQAYNNTTKTEWLKRLKGLVKYWHQRAKQDMDLYKSVRQQNLEALQIDERAEAQVGSFAYKWEVTQSYASPTLYNLCGIANCRTIHHSGVLFRKPRRHTTFTRCHVILAGGHLLIFQDTLRRRSGKKLVHIHHERTAAIDLQSCYLYSGVLTENDLLYQNRTFDSDIPGHHALPRVYLEDGWTSTDEDAMTTFVIWHAKSKSWFRSSQSVDDVRAAERANSGSSPDAGTRERTKTKLTRVSQLGATGRSVVFKARSRAERDHWVLAIQVEIERLAAQNEEVRLVNAGKASR